LAVEVGAASVTAQSWLWVRTRNLRGVDDFELLQYNDPLNL
jgi:hypothetical protein